MKSNLTKEIEANLLNYLRFKKTILVCNEVSIKHGICDIFGIKVKKFISKPNIYTGYEYEIKISKNDFKNELRSKNKIKKHKYYASGVSAPNKPNYFYYVTTPELKDFALNFVKNINKNYGIMIYQDGEIVSIKNSRKLCKIGNCEDTLLLNLLYRSTSAYCNLINKEQN
jgi:hypothetical protein